MNKEISYLNEKVFIGLDVHKTSYSVTAICNELVVKRWRMEASPLNLVTKLKTYFEGAELISTYEAGFSGFSLHRILEENGIKNLVINAGSLEVSSRDRVKTDSKDSHKLAVQLSVGRLKSIRIPSKEEELSREYSRLRKQHLRTRVTIMNRTRMKLHYHGIFPVNHKGALTKALVLEKAKTSPAELKNSLESNLRIWGFLDEEIKLLDKKLKEQAAKDKKELVYRSIPGVGKVSSRVLSTELGDMSQFKNEKALFSYTGLTPMEFSSGDKRRLGSISRQGNSHIRSVLVECAWVALRKDPELKASFERISARTGKKRAIVAIARKLIGRARALFRDGRDYEIRTI